MANFFKRFKFGDRLVDEQFSQIETYSTEIGAEITALQAYDAAVEIRLDALEAYTSTRFKITTDGGYAVALLNGTGTTSVKGTLLAASTSADDTAILQTNEYDTIGVAYEGGIAAGALMWVVVAGRCQLLVKNSTAITRSTNILAADTDGRCIGVASALTTDQHLKKIGNFTESKSGGTNVLCWGVLHG